MENKTSNLYFISFEMNAGKENIVVYPVVFRFYYLGSLCLRKGLVRNPRFNLLVYIGKTRKQDYYRSL